MLQVKTGYHFIHPSHLPCGLLPFRPRSRSEFNLWRDVMRRCQDPRASRGYGLLISLAVWLMFAKEATAQNPDALSPFFEGKRVVVKIDMPGTQKGIEIYPDRPQSLDAKSYGDRMKDFGVSLRQGDTTMVTKVKVNKDNIEFQLGGGGYGTARDNTDTQVHFTPAAKSDREKELENQLSNESDPDRRRSLQRELDYVRAQRERKDDYNRVRAEDDAARRAQEIAMKRQQGGSRFNIHVDARKMGDSLTPQVVEAALAQYVVFADQQSGPGGPPGGGNPGANPALVQRGPDQTTDSGGGLKKGMTREQVEALYGPASEAQEHTESGMTVTTCVYKGKDARVQADFVNGVLVRYLMSSY
jgi:hypothetical protein